MAPSPFKDVTMPEAAREMTAADIEALTEAFAEAAVRARACGYDGIELHGGNRYLLFAFVSPLINKRTDEYGGSLLGRSRFVVNIIRRIRQRVGDDFLIVYKMSVADEVAGGQTLRCV